MNFFGLQGFTDRKQDGEIIAERILSVPDFKRTLLDDIRNIVYFRLGDFTLATSYDNYLSHQIYDWKLKEKDSPNQGETP